MIVPRRSVMVLGSAAALSLFPPLRAFSQIALLSKLPWSFGAAQVVLTAIPFLRDWFQGGSSASTAVLCKLRDDDINNLEFRCLAVALALDADGDGPVVPPETGSMGIIPALADFAARPSHATVASLRDACLRMLDVSQNLLSEVANDYWLSALRSAGLESDKVSELEENLKYSRGRISDFTFISKDRHSNTSESDIEHARALSAQLAEMPLAAQNAIASVQAIASKRRNTAC
jgi:hypothetical protein